MAVDELTLTQQIAAGDSAAFGLWVAGVESSLRRTLRPFAALLDTEAVLQEGLLRVWTVAPRFVPDGKPNALLRFAAVTVRNVAVSELRKSKPSREQLDALESELTALEGVTPSLPDPHLREVISQCRDALPGKPKLALEQRLAGGGTEDDTTLAERLGMTLNTFLQNFTRARKLLAECLKKRGVELDGELI